MKRINKHSQIAKKLMASALALTICAPYIADSTYDIASRLTAHADYNGGGFGSGGGTGEGQWDGHDDMAIRLYVYDPTTGEIVKDSSGNQLVRDIMQTSITSGNNSSTFGKINGASVPWVLASDVNLSSTLASVFTQSGGDLVVNGSALRSWMLTERADKTQYNVIWLLLKLFGATGVQSLTADCYVVVEPMFSFYNGGTVLPLRAYAYSTLGGTLSSSYDYGKITAAALNGFQLTEDDLTSGINKTAPTAAQYVTQNSVISGLTNVGYGMHLYSLKDMPIPGGDPINTYDIENNPSTPSKSETPSSSGSSKTVTIDGHDVELKNDGDVNVIKVYMDAYVDYRASERNLKNRKLNGNDLNTSYYKTDKRYNYVEQKAIYGTTSTTKNVVVQDEFEESGYHLVGWETSGLDWKVSGDKIHTDTSGYDDWNGNDWLQVSCEALKVNNTDMEKRAGLSSNRTRYASMGKLGTAGNTASGPIFAHPRAKIGTVKDANDVVTHEYDYKAKDGTIVGKYAADGNEDKQMVELSKDEKTIYVLYLREKPWIETNGDNDPPPSGSGSGSKIVGKRTVTTRDVGDNSTTNEKDGGLNIVKVYGVIDDGDFHVSNIDTRAKKSGSYNVNITAEKAYDDASGNPVNWRLHTYAYVDAKFDDISKYTASQWADGTNVDTVLDCGYLDGFDYGKGKGALVEKSTGAVQIINVDESQRGRINTSLNLKPFFYGDRFSHDNDHTNDTLILLYLIDTQSEKTTGTVNIPESYLSKNFLMSQEQTVNKVTTIRQEDANGNYSSKVTQKESDLLAEHPFYYVLPKLSPWYTLVKETDVMSRYAANNGVKDGFVRYAKNLDEENSIFSMGAHNTYTGSWAVRTHDGNRYEVPYTLLDESIDPDDPKNDTFMGYDVMVGMNMDEIWSSQRSWYARQSNSFNATAAETSMPNGYLPDGTKADALGIVYADSHNRRIVADASGKAVSLIGTPSMTAEVTDAEAHAGGKILKLTGLDCDFTVFRDGDYANIAEWKYSTDSTYGALAIASGAGASMFGDCYNYRLDDIANPKAYKIMTLGDYVNTLGDSAKPYTSSDRWNTTVVPGKSITGGFANNTGAAVTFETKLSTTNSASTAAGKRTENGNNKLGEINLYFTDKTSYGVGSWTYNLSENKYSPAAVSLGNKTTFGTFGIYTLSENWYDFYFRGTDWKKEQMNFTGETWLDEWDDTGYNGKFKGVYPNWKNSNEKKAASSGDDKGLKYVVEGGAVMSSAIIRYGIQSITSTMGIDMVTESSDPGYRFRCTDSLNGQGYSDSRENTFAASYAKFLVDSGINIRVPVTYDTYKGDHDSSDNVVERDKAPAAQPVIMSTDDGKVQSGEQIDKGTIKFTPYIAMFAGTSQSKRIIDSLENSLAADLKDTSSSKAKTAEQKIAHNVDKYIMQILATQERELQVYDYAGLDYNVVKPGNNNNGLMVGDETPDEMAKNKKITLSSSQWSTHARAANIGKGNVLPGGATLALTTGKDGVSIVKAETWTAYLTGSGVDQMRATNPGSVSSEFAGNSVTDSSIYCGDDTFSGVERGNIEQMINRVVKANTDEAADHVGNNYALTAGGGLAFGMVNAALPMTNTRVKSTCESVIDDIIARQKGYVQSLVVGLESINIDQYVAPVPEDSISRGTSETNGGQGIITEVDTSKVAPLWQMDKVVKLNDVDESGYNNPGDKVPQRYIAKQEGKYYLRTDTSDYSNPQFINDTFELVEDRKNAGFGDLDTVTDDSKFTFYTFGTDTQGNIYMRYTKPMTETEFRSDTGITARAGCSFINDISADEIIYCANQTDSAAQCSSHYSDGSRGISTVIVLRRGEDISQLGNKASFVASGATAMSDADIKAIDAKTSIFTNLCYALERGTGNDTECPWALTDGKWYNEAFDGISYIQMTTDISTRFTNPYERNMVLDPDTTPGAEYGGASGKDGRGSRDKGDLLTQINYSQFRTRAYTEAYKFDGAGSKPATHKGADELNDNYDNYEAKVGSIKVKKVDGTEEEIAIKAPYLNELFISDIFYIPNATVQDLK